MMMMFSISMDMLVVVYDGVPSFYQQKGEAQPLTTKATTVIHFTSCCQIEKAETHLASNYPYRSYYDDDILCWWNNCEVHLCSKDIRDKATVYISTVVKDGLQKWHLILLIFGAKRSNKRSLHNIIFYWFRELALTHENSSKNNGIQVYDDYDYDNGWQ